jgi:hypothetical protein
MQELLLGPLFGTLVPQVFAYAWQHPWRVLAAAVVVVLLIDLMFGKLSSHGACGDCGDGGGDGGGGD